MTGITRLRRGYGGRVDPGYSFVRERAETCLQNAGGAYAFRRVSEYFRAAVFANSRHQFETRSHPCSLAATRRGFTFYVADLLTSIHEFTPIDFGISSRIRTRPYQSSCHVEPFDFTQDRLRETSLAVPAENRFRNNQRLKAWPRGLCPLRCSFASLRMTFIN